MTGMQGLVYPWQKHLQNPRFIFGIEARKGKLSFNFKRFSHRGDLVATAERDNRSLRF